MRKIRRTRLLFSVMLLCAAPSLVAAQPVCTVAPGSPLVAGCTNAAAAGRVEPNLSNSPGEPTPAFAGQEYLYGFSHVGDEVVWRGKYVASASATASPGVLKTQSIVTGRFEPDLLDQPRLGNAYASASTWFYDRITITIAGAPFGQDALIHASLLPIGGFYQVYDNLLGPANGYPLNPRGIFAVDLGASQFQSTSPTNSADEIGRLHLNVQFNMQGFAGYRVQHAIRSSETNPFESVVGDPRFQPIDFVIRFKSGLPFYLKGNAGVSASLEMTTAFPTLQVQPLGSISDLHVEFGNSVYWNGLSNAKVNGELRAFSVSSASGTDWGATMVPLPEPHFPAWFFLAGGIAVARLRRQGGSAPRSAPKDPRAQARHSSRRRET